MGGVLVSVVFLATFLTVYGEMCRCREYEPDETCNSVVSLAGTDECLFNSGASCSGCVCDLAGDQQCSVQETTARVRVSDSPKDGTGPCQEATVRTTKCGASFSDETEKRVVRDQCFFSGHLDVRNKPCGVMCFPPAYGKLDHITVGFDSTYKGDLVVTNPETRTLYGTVQVRQYLETDIRMNEKNVWPYVPGTTGYRNEYAVGPPLLEFITPPNHVYNREVSGSTEKSLRDPNNGNDDYVCPQNAYDGEVFFDLYARMRTEITSTVRVHSVGIYNVTVYVEYVFDAPVGSNHGLPYVEPHVQ